MTTTLSGIYTDPAGQPLAGVEIQFFSTNNTSNTFRLADAIATTDHSGAYIVALYPGVYNVAELQGDRRTQLGPIEIFADSRPGTLNDYLLRFDPRAKSPEVVRQLQEILEETRYLSANAHGPKGDKGDTGEKGDTGRTGMSAYELAVGEGYTGTEKEWLAALKGDKGDQGLPSYGVTPKAAVANAAALPTTGQTLGDAYWVGVNREMNVWTGFGWLNLGSLKGEKGDQGEKGDDGDQGNEGEKGDAGQSAYELAVDKGFTGTETQWLASLKGDKGEPGKDGGIGQTGNDGKSAYELAQGNGFNGSEQEWLASLKGDQGISAYDVAKANGYTGTQAEWLLSLKGTNGESAYEIALANGFQGSEADFIAHLKGDKGDKGETGNTGRPGDAGKSAYEIAVAGGFKGTQAEWIASLKGVKGDTGESAYQAALDNGFVGTQAEWIASLKGEKGDRGEKGEKGETGDVPANVLTTDDTQTITAPKLFTNTLSVNGAGRVQFSLAQSVTVPTPTFDNAAATKKYVDDEIDAAKSAVNPHAVQLTTDQTVGGKKTFTDGVVIPELPIDDGDATNKLYVDTALVLVRDAAVNDVTATIGGIQADIDARLTKTAYTADKATFATKTELATKFGQTETAKAIADAIKAMQLPANLAATDAANTFSALQTFGAGAKVTGGAVDLTHATSVKVPAPVDDADAATKKFVADQIATMAHSTADHAKVDADQTFTGANTFSGDVNLNGATVSGTHSTIDFSKATSVLVPTPTANGNPATKGYVDTQISDKLSGASNPGNPLANFATLDTAQTVTGDKTFTGAVVVPTPTDDDHAANKAFVAAQIAANRGNPVNLTGDQTVAGVKTFSASPIVPTPTTNTQAANKAYVDSVVNQLATTDVVTLAGSQRLTGDKNYSGKQDFEGNVVFEGAVSATSQSTFDMSLADVFTVPYPTGPAHAATKDYVDSTLTGAVATAGAQTITGKKTFAGGLVLPYAVEIDSQDASGNPVAVLRVGASGVTLGDTTQPVTLANSTTINGGLKAGNTLSDVDFRLSRTVFVPTPTADDSATTKKYVDDAVAASTQVAPSNMVSTDGVQNITGRKIFKGTQRFEADIAVAAAAVDMSTATSVSVPTPTANGQAATKQYVDRTVSTAVAGVDAVSLTGDQAIDGVKTFSDGLAFNGALAAGTTGTVDFSKATAITIPDLNTPTSPASRQWVGQQISAGTANQVTKTGDQDIDGNKTFAKALTVPAIKLKNGATTINGMVYSDAAKALTVGELTVALKLVGSSIDAGGKAVKAVLDPVDAQDAATKAYVDANRFNASGLVDLASDQTITGDKTFTGWIDATDGDITVADDPASDGSAVNKKYVDDAVGGLSLPTNVVTTDTTQVISGGKTFTGSTRLNGAVVIGANITSVAGGSADLSNLRNVYVPVPTDNRSAVTKAYVDTTVTGAVTAPVIARTDTAQTFEQQMTFSQNIIIAEGAGLSTPDPTGPIPFLTNNGQQYGIQFGTRMMPTQFYGTKLTIAADQGISLSQSKLTDLIDPVDASDAVTKSYADNLVKNATGYRVTYITASTSADSLMTATGGFIGQGRNFTGIPSEADSGDWLLLKVFRDPNNANTVMQELFDFSKNRSWIRYRLNGSWQVWATLTPSNVALLDAASQTFSGEVHFTKPVYVSIARGIAYTASGTDYNLIKPTNNGSANVVAIGNDSMNVEFSGRQTTFKGDTRGALVTIGQAGSLTPSIVNVLGQITLTDQKDNTRSLMIGQNATGFYLKSDVDFSMDTLASDKWITTKKLTDAAPDNAVVNKSYLLDKMAGGLVATTGAQTVEGAKTWKGRGIFDGGVTISSSLTTANAMVNLANASSVTVPDPTASSHAATKAYVDGKIPPAGVDLTSDQTIRGKKTFEGVTTFNSKVYLAGGLNGYAGEIDFSKALNVQLPTPVNANHAATKAYVDNHTLSFKGRIDADSSLKLNLAPATWVAVPATPYDDECAISKGYADTTYATKQYVDSAVANAGIQMLSGSLDADYIRVPAAAWVGTRSQFSNAPDAATAGIGNVCEFTCFTAGNNTVQRYTNAFSGESWVRAYSGGFGWQPWMKTK